MKQIIFSFFVISLIISCSKAPKQDGPSNEMLILANTKFEEKTGLTNGRETFVKASIPIANGESEAAKNINNSIFATVKLIVGQENDNSENYNELFSNFIKNYQGFVKETPEYDIPWEATIEGSVNYFGSDLINIKLESYAMTGGAHGLSYSTSLLFSPVDGKELDISNIVTDTLALSQVAEKKFREKYRIPADEDINTTGLMFNNDKFSLPKNIFITKEGLLLYYNVYEIAPYADGTSEVLIPYSEIKEYINKNI